MSPQQAALVKWLETAEERAAIEEFFEWAAENGFSFRATMSLTDLLDRYFGINRKDLNEGRAQLLQNAQETTEEKQQ